MVFPAESFREPDWIHSPPFPPPVRIAESASASSDDFLEDRQSSLSVSGLVMPGTSESAMEGVRPPDLYATQYDQCYVFFPQFFRAANAPISPIGRLNKANANRYFPGIRPEMPVLARLLHGDKDIYTHYYDPHWGGFLDLPANLEMMNGFLMVGGHALMPPDGSILMASGMAYEVKGRELECDEKSYPEAKPARSGGPHISLMMNKARGFADEVRLYSAQGLYADSMEWVLRPQDTSPEAFEILKTDPVFEQIEFGGQMYTRSLDYRGNLCWSVDYYGDGEDSSLVFVRERTQTRSRLLCEVLRSRAV